MGQLLSSWYTFSCQFWSKCSEAFSNLLFCFLKAKAWFWTLINCVGCKVCFVPYTCNVSLPMTSLQGKERRLFYRKWKYISFPDRNEKGRFCKATLSARSLRSIFCWVMSGRSNSVTFPSCGARDLTQGFIQAKHTTHYWVIYSVTTVPTHCVYYGIYFFHQGGLCPPYHFMTHVTSHRENTLDSKFLHDNRVGGPHICAPILCPGYSHIKLKFI